MKYNVCNKFNIWPQRKDKFIKFPLNFQRTEEETTRKEKLFQEPGKNVISSTEGLYHQYLIIYRRFIPSIFENRPT